jgi:hypothetical protein
MGPSDASKDVTHRVLCQSCKTPLTRTLVDLGLSPLANSFVRLPLDENAPAEPVYPLHARVCDRCLLVQVESVVPAAEIFSDYAYFSSYSDSWLAHVAEYADMAIDRFGLDETSLVVEIASNDGYLLQNFVRRGIPCLGIEPAVNVAAAAREKGVPTLVEFFVSALAGAMAAESKRPNLIVSKNVLAHVPDINDFVAGVSILLDGDSVYTVEFPHLLSLIEHVQFDTIYHEHYTYLSLLAVERIFHRHGLRVFDVEEIPTHGGSLRVFACRNEATLPLGAGVQSVREKELRARLDRPEGYAGFSDRVRKVRDDLLAYLNEAKGQGRRVAAYGAAAKGNTLLNYCSIGPDLIRYAVDRNPMKQNTLLPGSRIPVFPVEKLSEDPVDDILILPWNLRDEICTQLAPLREKGCRLVTAIPRIAIVD